MTDRASPADVFVGMGSNVGDRRAHLRAAVAALDAAVGVRVVGVSPVYETEAHVRPGAPPQRDHLNAVVRLSADLAPLDLLGVLHAAERAAGRDPSAEPWSARPLDLDVLLWNDDTLDLPGLTVPHPRLCHRRFVLAPLADLTPDRVVGGRTVAAWLASTADTSRVERTGGTLNPTSTPLPMAPPSDGPDGGAEHGRWPIRRP